MPITLLLLLEFSGNSKICLYILRILAIRLFSVQRSDHRFSLFVNHNLFTTHSKQELKIYTQRLRIKVEEIFVFYRSKMTKWLLFWCRAHVCGIECAKAMLNLNCLLCSFVLIIICFSLLLIRRFVYSFHYLVGPNTVIIYIHL